MKNKIIEFELEGHEHITLNNLLKFLNLAQSGGEANQIIDAGEVVVNNQTEIQRRKKLRSGDKIEFNGNSISIV